MQALVGALLVAIALAASGITVFIDEESAVVYFEAVPNSSPLRLALFVESEDPLNVVSGTIVFPANRLAVSVAKPEDTFVDVWLVDPEVDTEKGEVHFAGGSSSKTGLTERGKILELTITSSSNQYADLQLKDLETFGRDGRGTALKTGGRTYVVVGETNITPSGSGGGGASEVRSVLVDRADLNKDGGVGLSDVSILLLSMVSDYDSQYDLNSDGAVGLGDFSALITVYGKNVSPETPERK
jgi:hypothetical protein